MDKLGEFKTLDENGQLSNCKILGTFNSNNNLYIVYVDESDQILASRCIIKDNSLQLENDLTDAEFDLVDEFLKNN